MLYLIPEIALAVQILAGIVLQLDFRLRKMQVADSPNLQMGGAVAVHQVGLEFRDFVELGLASEIAEELLSGVLGVLLLRLESVGTALLFVYGQLLFARQEMAAIFALEFGFSQRKVELKLLGFLVCNNTAFNEFGVAIGIKELAGLQLGCLDLLRHNLFNY